MWQSDSGCTTQHGLFFRSKPQKGGLCVQSAFNKNPAPSYYYYQLINTKPLTNNIS